MDIIRKHGLWIIAGVVVICAIGFYFTVVRKLARERGVKVQELQTRRDKLKSHADKPQAIPGPNWVSEMAARMQEVETQLENCAEYLAHQPRDCHRRLFFEDENSAVGKEITDPIEWQSRLERSVTEVQNQLALAGLGSWVPEVQEPWSGRVPQPVEIREAQETFWFIKDLADVLTGQVEKDLQDLLDAFAESESAAFRKPADLVINRRLTGDQSLDALIRFLPKENLIAVIEAILINEGQADLPSIFDTHLKDSGYPWEVVLGLTRDDEQAKFLDELVPSEIDLANRRRFVEYVMELRSVRYRSDVIGLLENHDDGINGYSDVADSVKEVSPKGRENLLRQIEEEWSQTRIAQTIATIVSVYDEKDYRLLRDNHSPQIVSLSNVSFSRPQVADTGAASRSSSRGGGPGGGGGMGGLARVAGGSTGRITPYFKTTGFSMTVTIELEQLPVLLRRLLSNSWYYSVVVNEIQPVSGSSTTGGLGGVRGGGGRGLRTGGAMPTATRPASAAETSPTVAPRNYVTVDLKGEGYQFTPLSKTLKTESEEPSETPEASRPAGRARGRSRPVREASSE